MSLEFNPEHRNQNRIPIRCCSFCRRPGHNITTCNSLQFINFELSSINYINYISSVSNTDEVLDSFRNYLLAKAVNNSFLVKSFAIRKCGSTTRSNIIDCVNNIIQYFRTTIIFAIELNHNRRETYQEQEENEPLPQQAEQLNYQENENSLLPHETLEDTSNSEVFQRDPITLLMSVMFINFIRGINENNITNNTRKIWNINIKISENQENLYETCECNICYDQYEKSQFVKLECGHEFCKECIKKTFENSKPSCAFCRSEIKNIELKLSSIKEEFNELI